MKKLLLILLCLPMIYGCSKTTDIGDLDVALYETYEYSELFQALESANSFLRETAEADTDDEAVTEATDGEAEVIAESTDEVADLLAQIEADALTADSSVSRTFEEFATENPLYALLYPNVNQQTSQLNTGPVVGFCAVKDTAALNVYLKDDAIRKFFPVDVEFAYTVKPYDYEEKFVQLVALKLNTRNYKPQDSCRILKAQVVSGYSMPEISLELDSSGALQFKRLSAKNIGKSIAIVINGYVYAYPTVQQEIEGGRINITGNFILTEVKDLAQRINGRKVYFF